MKKKQVNEMRKAMLINAKLGLVKITTKNKQNLFKITEKGRRYVEEMPFENETEEAKWLQEYETNK